MSELRLLCDNLFARCEDPAPDGVRGSRLMQPLSDRKGHELKTFLREARDIFLIGWQLENGNALMENNSMGWYEAKDLEAIARFYREKLGVNAILGIHGGGDFLCPRT